MARADSTIRVNIIGDAKNLQAAAGKAEASIGGMNKKLIAAGGIAAGGFLVAADAAIEFGQTALKEADRVGDAAGRLEASLGADLTKKLRDRADDFHKLGASEGDMLELEARIADIGTAAGLARKDLAPFAEDAAELASGLELITDVDAATWIDKIGKAAASGDMRSLRDLGIFLDEAAVNARALADTGKPTVDTLTKQELAAARTAEVMQLLNDKYGAQFDAMDDVESKQADLQAQFETLTGKIGEGTEGPLNDFLGILLAIVDSTERSIEVLDAMGAGFDELLTPVARAADGLREFLGVVNGAIDGMNELLGLWSSAAGKGLVKGGQLFTPSGSGGGDGRRATTNVYVQGGSPEVIEQAVRRATNTTARRG